MTISAEDLADGAVLRARVAVVGAGPAGLTVAAELAAAGVDVLVLEAAGPGRSVADLETTRSTGLFYDTATKRGRGVGGGARAWNIVTPAGAPFLRLRELDPLDLEVRPGVRGVGWPLGPADLAPHYRAAWAAFGLPPAEPSREVRGEAGGEAREYRFGPASAFTERVPDQLRASGRVRLVTGAVVTDVRTDADPGVVSSLEVRTGSGRRLVVEAAVHVLAAGGIENARTLLASRSRSSAGLGNAHDHVGRYFMEHPHYPVGVVVPSDRHLETSPGTWDQHLSSGVAVQHTQALPEAVTRAEGLLNSAYYVEPRSPRDDVLLDAAGRLDASARDRLRGLRSALVAQRPSVGSAHELGRSARDAGALVRYRAVQALATRAAARGRPRWAPPRVLDLKAMAEQSPDPLSRITLAEERDAYGVPVAVLDWRLNDLDRASMARSDELAAAHLRRVLRSPVLTWREAGEQPRVHGGAHQIGTTRMAASEREGVVDPDGRVFGVRNLFVAGSSVFPAGGSANPTLTVVALAVRLGRHLVAELAAPEVRAGR